MRDLPQLNFPPVKFRALRKGNEVLIWDALRKTYLTLTPEEWVRQHAIRYLTEKLGVPDTSIQQEYPVSMDGMLQRADVVVVDRMQKPLMLIECKAAEVKIDASVFNQAVRYNSRIGARYVMLTNGLTHYCYVTWNGRDYAPVDSLPDLSELFIG